MEIIREKTTANIENRETTRTRHKTHEGINSQNAEFEIRISTNTIPHFRKESGGC